MRSHSFVRPMLVASAIMLWCGGFVRAAAGQSITCTGNQTNTDAFGNQCMSLVATGPQGASHAIATASGPLLKTSSATSQATNNSSAISNADISCSAGAFAFNSSTVNVECTSGGGVNATAMDSGTANAEATSGGGASSTATNFGTANAQATLGGNAQAFATNSGTANAEATGDSGASVFANGPGTAIANASDEGQASATVGSPSVQSNGNAYAVETDGSGAQATVTTPNGFACAFATEGSFAQASDTSPPVCDGPDAAVVSSAGSCGQVQNSPCALELHNYFSNANTTGGQAFVYVTAPFEGDPTSISAAVQEGETCAMIYVLDTHQALQACCGCPVTADALLTLSISGNLAPNPLATGKLVHDGSIRIIPSAPNASLSALQTPPYEGCDAVTGICCDPTALSTGHQLIPASKLLAWANHVQSTQITETQFESVAPTAAEVDNGLPATCADTVRLGSGQGICTCPGGT